MPGGSVNITCVAVGSPMPYVKWMLGPEDLTPEDEMPIGRNVLELNGVRESANYTCVAMSSLGVIEAMAQVLVKSKKHSEMPADLSYGLVALTVMWHLLTSSPTEAPGNTHSYGDHRHQRNYHLGLREPGPSVLLHHPVPSQRAGEQVRDSGQHHHHPLQHRWAVPQHRV